MTAASAISLSARSLRPAATYCSAASFLCFTSFWIILSMSPSETSFEPPSAVLKSNISPLIARVAFIATVSFAFMASLMASWICCSKFMIISVCFSRSNLQKKLQSSQKTGEKIRFSAKLPTNRDCRFICDSLILQSKIIEE